MSTQIEQSSLTRHLIEPKRIPEGFLLTHPENTFSWFMFIFTILCVLGGLSFPVFIVLLLIYFFAGPGLTFLLLLTSIFLAFGAFWVVLSTPWLPAFIRLKPGTVVLSSYPLRMGESCRIQYRRRLRWGSTPRPGKITAKWLCYEWVDYGQGTDVEIKTHALWETDLPEMFVASGTQLIGYEAQVKVPLQGPPSLDAENNQVRWEIHVTVDLPGVAKYTSDFRFRVTPEIMP